MIESSLLYTSGYKVGKSKLYFQARMHHGTIAKLFSEPFLPCDVSSLLLLRWINNLAKKGNNRQYNQDYFLHAR